MSNELRDTMASVTGNFAAHDDESLGAMIARWPHDTCKGCRHDACRNLDDADHCNLCHRCQSAAFHARAMKVVDRWTRGYKDLPNDPFVKAMAICAKEMKELFGKVTP